MASIHKKKLRSGTVVWELTHGDGASRVRLVVGKTRQEAEASLALFKRQLALHGDAPEHLSVRDAVERYREYLRLNRSPATLRRYERVLATFAECFLPQFHGEVRTLREIKPHHLEEYKRRRIDGEIVEAKERLDSASLREEHLRRELQENSTAPTRATNARYGWLGRKHLKGTVTRKTVNYELETLRTFFLWCVKRNYLFVNPMQTVSDSDSQA